MIIKKCLPVLTLVLLLAITPACGSAPIIVSPASAVSTSSAATPLPASTPLPKPYKHNIGEARTQINAWLLEHQPEFSMTADGAQETDFGITDLFDQTHMQFYQFEPYIYALYGDGTQRFLCFSVLLAETADVDGDGQPELALLCEVGSGRYIYQLIVLKNGTPYTYTVANSGSAIQFRFDKKGESELNLYCTAAQGSETKLGQIILREGTVNLIKE